MGGSQKSKRVSWASDVNLCQVRLFLSEESPSQVGLGTQDHLQAKTLWPAMAGGMGPDENLPPGFEGIQPANPWAVKLSQVPLVKWKCPPRFEVNGAWRVVAGEESKETETQNQRELRVLEAIYPRPSAIPPNPSVLAGADDLTSNDQYAPVVPITPIEEEDASLDSPPMISQQHNTSPGASANGFLEPEVVAAAQAALSSVMSNSGQGNLIDRELLIKILSDPKMIEQLITNHAASSGGQPAPSSIAQSMPSPSILQQGIPAVGLKSFASSSSSGLTSTSAQFIPNLRPPSTSSFDPVNIVMSRRDPVPPHVTRPELIPPSMAPANAPFYPPSRVGSVPDVMMSAPSPSVGAPVTKDINYYKSLIQQHGGERRESVPQFAHQSNQVSQEPSNMMMKPGNSKPKIMKPCIYFNSSRGCRNGASCTYQHDVVTQHKVNTMPEVQSSKRVKLDREVAGS